MECLRQSGFLSRLVASHTVSPGAASDFCTGSKPLQPLCFARFFLGLEASGSASPRTGWGPRHLIARCDGVIAGIVPCYLKSHSQGEYVFDRGWADAYERAGGRYYPKLQVSVPFTPATGPRLLIRDGVDRSEIATALWRDGLVGALPGDESLIGARDIRARSRMEVAGRATASCSGPTSSSIGTTRITTASTISLPRSIRATARRSSGSGATRSPTASPSMPSTAAISPRKPGTRSLPSTWRPARANGAGLT